MVYDKVFCLVDKFGQEYADLLEAWKIGLPAVQNPPLVLADRADISGKVRIVPKFCKELPKSFWRDELPESVDRAVRSSAAKF